MTDVQLAEFLAYWARGELGSENESGWRITSNEPGLTYANLSRRQVQEILQLIAESAATERLSLTSHLRHEVLVADDLSVFSRARPRRSPDDLIQIQDEQNGISYALTRPSNALITSLLLKITGPEGHARITRRMQGIALVGLRSRSPEPEQVEVWDVFDRMFRRWSSLIIETQERQTPEKFSNLTSSVLFHLAYNLETALSPVHHLQAILPGEVRLRDRRDRNELDPPKRLYHSELVERYIAAIGSEDTVSKYLGFYHVAEHYFESLFNQYVVGKVRDKLTAPGFSVKRDQDIQGLVKFVSKLVRERQNETAAFDEQRALQLTLEEYVDPSNLCVALDQQVATSIEYYRTTEVEFSDGDRVDLEADPQVVLPLLTKRIYKTRNAVVHAKTGERSRYRPRTNQAALARELPLIRAVAEEILIATAALL